MTSRFLLLLLTALALVGVSCEINDPFTIGINLPLEACGEINTGNSWTEDATYNIRDEIANVSESYLDQVKATRVVDIQVYMPAPPAGSGTGSGVVQCGLDGVTPVTIMTFTNVPFSSLGGNGISLGTAITNPTLVQIDTAALHQLENRLNADGLPVVTTVRVITSGSTSTSVPQGTSMCARIQYQADIEISP
jgi:hypothetical protein